MCKASCLCFGENLCGWIPHAQYNKKPKNSRGAYNLPSGAFSAKRPLTKLLKLTPLENVLIQLWPLLGKCKCFLSSISVSVLCGESKHRFLSNLFHRQWFIWSLLIMYLQLLSLSYPFSNPSRFKFRRRHA